jgi:hypothetical protein
MYLPLLRIPAALVDGERIDDRQASGAPEQTVTGEVPASE